jgi:hydroxymethylglutaryl-CoA lyase
MASTAEILDSILARPPTAPHSIAYNYLVPNIRGLENLVKIFQAKGAHNPTAYPSPPPSPSAEPIQTQEGDVEVQSANSTEVSLFAAATETFSQKNTNCSIAESLERCRPIMELAKQHDIRVRGYVSVALGCPYEGPDVDPHRVAEITATLLEMGCDEVSVADTTGMGTAPRTRKLLDTLKEAGILNEDLALHFHDTYGMALVNTVVGLEHGVRIFDSSVGGLGGCPYSKGATGNVATEDLVHLLHSLGCETGIDMAKMAEIGQWITAQLNRPNDSRAGKATLARMKDS